MRTGKKTTISRTRQAKRRTILPLVLAILFPCLAGAQNLSHSSRWLMMPGAGYHYQRSHAVELTLRAACFAGHPNAGVFGGATLLWYKAAYLAPTAGLRLFTPLPVSINRVHSRLGLALQATYLLIPRGGAKDQYVTPEIGINWDGATTLYYGHNIWLRSSDFQPFGAHRVALRFSFW